MKLSFSIKGWERYAWADYVRIAKEMELQGIELRNIHSTPLTARGGPFHAHMASATLRELYEAGLPCGSSMKRGSASPASTPSATSPTGRSWRRIAGRSPTASRPPVSSRSPISASTPPPAAK